MSLSSEGDIRSESGCLKSSRATTGQGIVRNSVRDQERDPEWVEGPLYRRVGKRSSYVAHNHEIVGSSPAPAKDRRVAQGRSNGLLSRSMRVRVLSRLFGRVVQLDKTLGYGPSNEGSTPSVPAAG